MKMRAYDIRIFVFTAFFGLCLPGVVSAQWDPVRGFAEVDYGVKVSDDTTKRDSYNMLEQRLQLKTSYYFQGNNYLADKQAAFNFKGDLTLDEYYDGRTDFELREANLAWTPFDMVEAKAGRQVLTWGTGDYLFINDLFPKDYESFFIGRDDEYLKKPSDALKLSFYPRWASVDFVVMPYFTPNTIATGDRLSFFDSFQGGIAGVDSDRDIRSPAFRMSNNEYALRMYKTFGSNEAALYYFRGFDKNPRSYADEMARQLMYERLDVYGWSLRGPFAGGIGNVEMGYYNSRQDTDGTNRTIENSFYKALAGYNKDLRDDWKIGLQYFYEQRLDYANYKDALLTNDYYWDEHRHLLTTRLTKLFKSQTVMASLFAFWSPTDRDGYLRPSVSYDMTDRWKLTFGANLPWGEDVITEFGQMQKNKNVFFRVKYSF